MSEEELEQFEKSLQSFLQHANVEELNYLRRESTRKYNQSYYSHKAKELGVDLDYYMKEFVV